MIVFDHSRDGEMRSCDDCKARLGIAYADIAVVHDVCAFSQVGHDASAQRIRESFDRGGHHALTELGNAAEIAAIGAGVNEWQVCGSVLKLADFDGFLLAGRFTPLEQDAVGTFLLLCEERDVGIIPGGPFNSGILATGYVAGARATTPTRRWKSSEESNERTKSARRMAHGSSRRPPVCHWSSRREIGDSRCIDRCGCQIERVQPCSAVSTRVEAGLAGNRTHSQECSDTDFRRQGSSAMMPGFRSSPGLSYTFRCMGRESGDVVAGAGFSDVSTFASKIHANGIFGHRMPKVIRSLMQFHSFMAEP